MTNKPNLSVVDDALDNAKPLKPEPKPKGDGGEPPSAGWTARDDGLPEGCPVIPLGKEGDGFWYVDACRQVVHLKAREHGRAGLSGLFAPYSEKLVEWWPRWKKVKEQDESGNETEHFIVNGCSAEKAADALMNAAAAKGVWRQAEKVRGLGTWRDRAGNLVLHLGNRIVTVDGEKPPGEHDGFIYPSDRPLPGPADEAQPAAAGDGPAMELLDLLKTWNWERGDADAQMLLGDVVAMMLGGALDWRPAVFITGDAASGKSTIHKLLGLLLGEALIHAADTTAAGIYQHVGQSSLPVAIDELENDEDSRRARAVLELARLASSGSVMLRGGATHTGTSFKARSCFLFSAILVPPLKPQDRQRMAILNLGPLQGSTAFAPDPRHFATLGRQLLRRAFDQWPRFEATLAAYREALMANGHSMRGADQFGTLLACADLLLSDEVPDADTAAQWGKRLARDKIVETSGERSDAQSCLDYLVEAQPEHWRSGAKETVAEMVAELVRDTADGVGQLKSGLSTGGMCVCRPRGYDEHFLAVGVSHRGTEQLFRESRWRGAPGIVGPWAQALGRLPGTLTGTQRIGGKTTRCVMIPASLFIAAKGAETSHVDQEPPVVERAPAPGR